MSQVKLTADTGGGTTSIKGPAQTTGNADVVLKLPVADGSSGEVLKTDGSGQLSFTSNAGTTINNNADNRVITGSGTANTLNGEANCTFNGDSLGLNSSSTSEINLQTSNNTRFKIQAGSNFAQFLTQNNVPLAFKTDAGTSGGTERMRIDTSGRVLIGTTTEGNNNGDELTIAKDSGNMGMTLRSGDSSNSHIYFSDATSGAGEYAGYIAYQHSDDSMHIGTNSAERIHIKSNGLVGIGTSSPTDKLHVAGTTNLAGNAYLTNAYVSGNIYLGGTGSANALNDYEEGTWTPDWRGASALGTTTYGNYNAASYVKIGNQVTVRGHSQIAGSSGGSGFWFINNLPFTVGGGDDRRYRSVGSVMIEDFNFGDDVVDVVCFVERNNNDMQLRGTRDNAGASTSISVNNDTSFDIMFTVTYPTA